MNPTQHICVAHFSNDTQASFTLYLELLGEEVVLAPGFEVDLLALPSEQLLRFRFATLRAAFKYIRTRSSTQIGMSSLTAKSFALGILRC